MAVLKNMVEALILAQHGRTPIEEFTPENYERWDRGFIFDALKDQRYGQNFCNHFGITDNILFYERDVDRCQQMIREHYLKSCDGE